MEVYRNSTSVRRDRRDRRGLDLVLREVGLSCDNLFGGDRSSASASDIVEAREGENRRGQRKRNDKHG